MKPGVAFPDFIKTEKIRRRKGGNFFGKNYPIRSFVLPLLLITAVSILFVRLFFLQVIRGIYYRYLADSNRIRTIIINAPRGIIFDRNNTPLVFNTPGYRQSIDGKTRILNNQEAISLISRSTKDLEIDSLRFYPYKEILSHTLGYIGQISEEEIKNPTFRDYKIGDLVGKIGIEEKYESVLRGIQGKRLVEVDNVGKVIRKLGQTDAIQGQNIMLTIDIGLQKAVYNAMQDVKKGATIVSNLNGEILALVSKPSFDTNLFTQGEGYNSKPTDDYASIDQILSDEENQPLINRAISGLYPPGSTFKLVVAASGLENNIIDKNFAVEDTGILRIGEFSFGNWYFTQYGKTEGTVDVVKALKRSNDIYFYKVAELVGVDKLSQFAEKFGLGEKTGIDLAGEEDGLVPTQEWKKNVVGENWYLGDTYHYGIGQGYLLTTPLQVNMWTQAIANVGTIYKPHLLKNTTNTTNTTNKQISKKFLLDETVSLIKEGMVQSCSPGGVAWPLFEFKIPTSAEASAGRQNSEFRIACKTGTAEHGGKEDLPHAWITLFAPSENPEIVITVLSESSGEGSNIAAPIAKKILEYYFTH